MIETLLSPHQFATLINCGLAATLVCTLVLVATWAYASATRHSIGHPAAVHRMLSISIVFLLFLPIAQILTASFPIGVIRIGGDAAVDDLQVASQHVVGRWDQDVAKTLSNVISIPWIRYAVALTWLSGATFCAVRFVLGIILIRRMRLESTSSHDERLNRVFENAVNAVIPSRRPRLVLTNRQVGPLVCGFCRPTIIISRDLPTLLSDNELTAVLIHECEHVRRRDALLVMTEQIASCIYWWNPLLVLLRRWLVDARERACDDRVFANVSSPKIYASALLIVAQWSLDRPKRLETVALLPRRSDLVDRISRATETPSTSKNHHCRRRLAHYTTVLATALLACMPILSVLPTVDPDQFLALDLHHSDAQMLAEHQLAYVRIRQGSRQDIIEKLLRDSVPELSRGLIVDLRDSHPRQLAGDKGGAQESRSQDLYQMVQRQITEYKTGDRPRRPVVILVQKQGISSAVMLHPDLQIEDVPSMSPPAVSMVDPQLRMAVDLLSHV